MTYFFNQYSHVSEKGWCILYIKNNHLMYMDTPITPEEAIEIFHVPEAEMIIIRLKYGV